MPRTIRTEIQKRFSDIDSFRHVNNVSQQMYFDVGKSDFFDRLLGPEILFAPVRIITAATDTSYMGQIRPEDRIAVTTLRRTHRHEEPDAPATHRGRRRHGAQP